ncbi:MAG: Stp1/IreP family PP2C-type Ser/Thr phosphatase [bacterium]
MGFHFKFGVMTDVGKIRALNEDNFYVAEDMGLFMVADGLGGQKAGEVASRMAIETIKRYMNNKENPLTGKYHKEFSQDTNRILSGIRLANSEIYKAGQRDSEHQGMGTTISSVLINRNVMTLAHVGDSRIYRIRGGHLEQLTKDHSVVQEQLKRGIITKEEAEKSNYRSIITRALGAKETIRIDADEEVLLDHDRILICTDGLTDMVREDDIVRIILNNEDDPQKACKELIDKAKGGGGMDNITVILLYCEKDEQKVGFLERVFLPIISGLRKASSEIQGFMSREKGDAPSRPERAKREGNM